MMKRDEEGPFMSESLKPELNPDIAPAPAQPETVELNDAELKDVSGGAFDAYMNFPTPPNHP